MGDDHSQETALTLRLKPVNPADKSTLPEELKLTPGTTVEQVKGAIENKNEVPIDQQKLIYRGKVLINSRTLESYGVNSGDTFVYLRSKKKALKPSSQQPASQTTNGATTTESSRDASTGVPSNVSAASTTQPATSFPPAVPGAQPTQQGGLPPLGIPGLPFLGQMNQGTPPGFPDMNQMSQNLMSNPEFMRNIMNSPMMQGMMNNPDILRNMFQNNPQIQRLLEQNPQLSHILNDPEMLRNHMEIMRNPERMQEMMRQQDLMMSNIENMPGGYNALRQNFERIQRPMMDALGSRSEGQDAEEDDEEHAEPAPSDQPENNPWGPNTAANASPSGNAAGQNQGATNPLSSMLGGMNLQGAGAGQIPPHSNPLLNPGAMPNPNMFDPQLMSQVLSSFSNLSGRTNQAAQNPGANSQSTPTNPQYPPPPPVDLAQMMQGLANLNNLMGASGVPPAHPFAGTGGTPVSQPDSNLPPEQRFATQLLQLEQMGFTNRQDNVAALTATNGNIDMAIDRLLGMGL